MRVYGARAFFVLFLLLGTALSTPARPVTRAAPARLDPVHYVNPFIGTDAGGPDYGINNAGGHTFPGAAYPNGMVQWSPDTTSAAGGYRYSQSIIQGFSLTHFSGRGCASYQDFPFMPTIGPIGLSPGTHWSTYTSPFSHTTERATPGYYSVRLDSVGIWVHLTVTPRTGLGEFIYPASSAATMLVNVGGSATGDSEEGTGVQIIGNNEIAGSATSGHFCGASNTYTIYFVAEFDRPFTRFGTWKGPLISPGGRSINGAHTGAYVSFDTTTKPVVRMKVGVSFVSVTGAQANLAVENPSWNFPTVCARARAAWNRRLSRIQIVGGTSAQKIIFYTALYHTLFHPNIFSDVNGQYMGFDKRIHTARGYTQYENFPGWDMYRSELPLLAVLMPKVTSDMMQSLVADAQQGGGGLPKWEVANDNSGGMVGDSQDVVIASAYAFGARRFNTRAALRAMVLAASQPNTRSGGYIVRPGLDAYLLRGYIPLGTPDVWGPAATTLEYAIDDFAIAQFAQALGKRKLYAAYVHRAQNWRNLFNPASGYIEPRNSNGAFVSPFSPTDENGYVEGDGAQYTWLVPYNLKGLFAVMGGKTRVMQRLDMHFTQLNAGPASPYVFMGNEPEFEVPWEYDFAGVPDRTQDLVRRIVTELFQNTPAGLVGNDDGGALSSWFVWAALGLYPEIPGVAGFAVGSPLFPKIVVQLGNGHRLRIEAPGASDTVRYVQQLSMAGHICSSPWLPFAAVAGGATLHFQLGSIPNTRWGMKIRRCAFSHANGERRAGLPVVGERFVFSRKELLK
jgi:predicted alpha-1,2-mannosidase